MTSAMKPLLTERTHAILIGLVRQGGRHTATYLQQLHDKLQKAVVVPSDAIDPDVVTLGSSVRYRVNKGGAMEHNVALYSKNDQEHQTLSIKSVRGLALLGMREGDAFTAWQSPDRCEDIEIEMIMMQPEADGELLRVQALRK